MTSPKMKKILFGETDGHIQRRFCSSLKVFRKLQYYIHCWSLGVFLLLFVEICHLSSSYKLLRVDWNYVF